MGLKNGPIQGLKSFEFQLVQGTSHRQSEAFGADGLGESVAGRHPLELRPGVSGLFGALFGAEQNSSFGEVASTAWVRSSSSVSRNSARSC